MGTVANEEYTFVTPRGNEWMVWFDNEGKPTKIYAYRDTSESIAKNWKVGKNSLFIHCPEGSLLSTWEWMKKKKAYCNDLEPQ